MLTVDPLQTEYASGAYGIKPWSTLGGFYDITASWIWNTPLANVNAPIGQVTFQATFVQPEITPFNATLHVMADNIAQVFINGTLIADIPDKSWTGATPYPMIKVLIPVGTSTFTFNVTNTYNYFGPPDMSNPAGLIYALVDPSGLVMLHSGCGSG